MSVYQIRIQFVNVSVADPRSVRLLDLDPDGKTFTRIYESANVFSKRNASRLSPYCCSVRHFLYLYFLIVKEPVALI
jgi:hypothetical protein